MPRGSRGQRQRAMSSFCGDGASSAKGHLQHSQKPGWLGGWQGFEWYINAEIYHEDWDYSTLLPLWIGFFHDSCGSIEVMRTPSNRPARQDAVTNANPDLHRS